MPARRTSSRECDVQVTAEVVDARNACRQDAESARGGTGAGRSSCGGLGAPARRTRKWMSRRVRARLTGAMSLDLLRPAKAAPGDRVAVVSPSFAAPAVAVAVHEQALRRLTEVTGLVPVEYPTTRRLDASAADRAADLNAAFGDPSIRAVLATIGGEDQITVVPHLDPDLVRRDPKPFLGYSDNTN